MLCVITAVSIQPACAECSIFLCVEQHLRSEIVVERSFIGLVAEQDYAEIGFRHRQLVRRISCRSRLAKNEF